MSHREFVETEEKGVHLVNGEFTLCGDAFDMAGSEKMLETEWKPTKKRIVTCVDCMNIIMLCRGVRILAEETC